MKRTATQSRATRETDIELTLCLDGGESHIDSGIGFFDHMLAALSLHAGWGLDVKCRGDLQVDGHHSVEDIGIVLGQALREAMGGKLGMERFGHAYVPMDEALGFAAVDAGGRACLELDCDAEFGMIGDYDASLTREFFRALSANAGITLHLKGAGMNAHHVHEAVYKAAGRALRVALALTQEGIASTKGVL